MFFYGFQLPQTAFMFFWAFLPFLWFFMVCGNHAQDIRESKLVFSEFTSQICPRFHNSVELKYFDLNSCYVIFQGDEVWKVACKIVFMTFKYILNVKIQLKCVQAKNFFSPNMMKMCPVSNTLSYITQQLLISMEILGDLQDQWMS